MIKILNIINSTITKADGSKETKKEATIFVEDRSYPASFDIRDRTMSFTVQLNSRMDLMNASTLIAPKLKDAIEIRWDNYRRHLVLHQNFPWDSESRKKIREIIVAQSNERFDTYVRKTGLLDLYKHFKRGGARLVAEGCVRHGTTDPEILFKQRDERIKYDVKTKKMCLIDERKRGNGWRSRRTYDHTVLSSASMSTFRKKLDKFLLREFLEIQKAK